MALSQIQVANDCVVCGNPIHLPPSPFRCQKCGESCEGVAPKESIPKQDKHPEPYFADIKSKCCNADVNTPKITCSDECHEVWVRIVEAQFGEFKEIIAPATGLTHAVPTRYLIEHGITEAELKKYPITNPAS